MPDNGSEAMRATCIMRATAGFLDGCTAPWHLDLHSAIRPSVYARFAVVPAPADDVRQDALVAWLGTAAIEAVVFNRARAPTYSAHTLTPITSRTFSNFDRTQLNCVR